MRSEASAGQRLPGWVWGCALLAVAIRAGVAATTHFTNEDFFITLRYARNIGGGLGFCYNPGERYLGTTTPLYALFLGLAVWLGLPAAACGKAANVLADGLLCIVIYRWLTKLGYERAGRIAALLLAVDPLQIRWSISGMETSIATLLCATAFLLYSERRTTLLFVDLGFLFLVRWDSLLLTGVLLGCVVLRDRRVPVRGLLAFVAIAAPWTLFAASYFGSPIPGTMAAKATVYGWRFQGRILPGAPKLLYRIYGTPGYAALAALAAAGLIRAIRCRMAGMAPAVAWAALYWAAFLISKNLLFEWYLVPPATVYLALVALALDGTASRAPALSARPVWLAAPVAALAAGGFGIAYAACRESQQIEESSDMVIGKWLSRNTEADDVVMLEPIGYAGYYSGRRILDPVGLVTPYVLTAYRRDNPAPFLTIARTYRPAWCVLRPGELSRITRAAAATGRPWERDYEPVKTWIFFPARREGPIVYSVFRRR
jgi:hypothetical protein